MDLSPSDFENSFDRGYRKINIDDLIRQVKLVLKEELVRSSVAVFDEDIELTTTKTRFGGEKFWFVCPSCEERKGILYVLVGKKSLCRDCIDD